MLPIRVLRMRAAPAVTLNANAFYGSAVTPADASCNFTIDNLRQVYGDGVTTYNWIPASLTPGDYQIIISNVVGTFSTGAAGTFNLGTSRSWTRIRIPDTPGAIVVTFDAQIQRVSDSVMMTPVRAMSLTAEVLP